MQSACASFHSRHTEKFYSRYSPPPTFAFSFCLAFLFVVFWVLGRVIPFTAGSLCSNRGRPDLPLLSQWFIFPHFSITLAQLFMPFLPLRRFAREERAADKPACRQAVLCILPQQEGLLFYSGACQDHRLVPNKRLLSFIQARGER